MNKFFALFAAIAISVAGAAFAQEKGPDTIKLPAKPGSVTFPHKAHQDRGIKCTQCHDSDKGGPIEGFNKTVNKDKAHAKCHECHKKEKKGPQKCAECHKKGT